MKSKSTQPKLFPLFLPYLLIYILSFAFVTITSLGLIKFNSPCANSISCTKSLELNINNQATAVFQNQTITPPSVDLLNQTNSNVQGEATASGEKKIYVNLTTQTLSAYEGEKLYFQTPISSGKWGKTPTGEFSIWSKVRSTRMTGGSGSDYYDLPNVEYVMFFYNDQIPQSRGYGFHGAYWHNNFGHPMSHGCINMRNIDAKKLYEWADPSSTSNTVFASQKNLGTKIIIYGESK